MLTVIALGGNAISPADADYDTMRQRIRTTAERLGPVLAERNAVLTHGNGPQVGRLLLQEEEIGGDLPLDVLVAETQAQIGYLLQQALDDATPETYAAIVTQVLVDGDDPAFDDPSKPVGPWYTAEEADERDFPTRDVGSGDRPYRRVVPSPAPREILEDDAIAALLDAGRHVICCGGGGVPVVRDGGLRGVEAVVDKDRTAAVLARDIDARELVLITDVPYAYRDPDVRDDPIRETTPDEMAELRDEGVFGAGSMRPKVEACIEFIRQGGERAIITDPAHVAAALDGEAGTRVTP